MKRIFIFFILCLFFGCSKEKSEVTDLSMLEGGKTFAVPSGTVADKLVLDRFPDAKIIYFNNILDCALAVKEGKADATSYDKPVLENIAAKVDGVAVLKELLQDDKYGFAVQKGNSELKKAMDEVLKEIKSDGTYDKMSKRWFPSKGIPGPMPEVKLTGENGILRFGTAAVTEPMSYVDANQNVVGFDIEYATYIARKLGKKLEIVNMEFGAMLPALISGKVDMVGAGLSITKEREKSVLFSESYYPSGIAALVRSGTEEKRTSSENKKFRTFNDIGDKRIGVLLGSIHENYAMKYQPKAEILQYQNVSDMITALKHDKVDAAYFDHATLRDVLAENSDLGILAANVFSVPIAAAFNENNDDLRLKFNKFLKEIKSNGVYQDMVDRWINKGLKEIPPIENKETNGELKTGVVCDLGAPFTFVKDGQIMGFDIELPMRFAAWLGKKFVPVDIQFGSMIASISTNKVDLATCSMMITEEREKQVDFSDPYYESGISVIARKVNIEKPAKAKLASLEDISDKTIGIFSGTVHDAFLASHYPKAKVKMFDSSADMILSLETGKIDVAMFDQCSANVIMKKNLDLGLLSNKVLNMPLGVGFSKKNPALRNKFNTFLKKIKEDGTYEKMHKRWFEDDPEKAVMPEYRDNASGEKLNVAVSVDDLPYVAFSNKNYVGFDVEMIQRFAAYGGYNMEMIMIEFPALIAALTSGKVDIITDGIAISDERKKSIDFSDTYAEFVTAMVALKKDLPGGNAASSLKEKKSFFKSVSESFYNNIILEDRYKLILDGLKVTLLISILAALLGTLLGGLVCFMRMSKKKILSGFAKAYISLLRGTPVLVLLMIIFYVVFASVNINPTIVAVIAFGLNFAAYVSEMFRTSIASVDIGQKEAGIAGGFTKVQTFINIIMPQALRHVLPVYKGEFISLVKMTSIVGYIAVQDVTRASDIIRSRTFDAFFPLIMAAVIYLLLAWLLTWALDQIEISVDPKRKRIKRIEEVAQ
jgi:polar amino acid transport system substrate-binding protein